MTFLMIGLSIVLGVIGAITPLLVALLLDERQKRRRTSGRSGNARGYGGGAHTGGVGWSSGGYDPGSGGGSSGSWSGGGYGGGGG